jgi:hypothetical protein
MLIPVFVSSPTNLSDEQDACRRLILGELGHHGLEGRTIGQTDYPTSFPLRKVLTLARHCSGGIILGFSQLEVVRGVWKRGTPHESEVEEGVALPTPWNNLEAGVLFARGVPLLIFREAGISGGVFDNGVTDLFLHPMPKPALEYQEDKALKAVFQRWTAQVRGHYYGNG